MRAKDPRPWLTLEEHLGFSADDPIRSESELTMVFGGAPVADSPQGSELVRRFRRHLEVTWNGEAFGDDLSWNAVLIAHYRGPLSEAPRGDIPPLNSLRELHDCTATLFEKLLASPPPEMRTLVLHTPVARGASLIARALEFPGLEYLLVHLLERDAGLVLTDELLERHAWLDCRSLEDGASLFELRR